MQGRELSDESEVGDLGDEVALLWMRINGNQDTGCPAILLPLLPSNVALSRLSSNGCCADRAAFSLAAAATAALCWP